ncbi:MAG: hypothetical protein JJU13_02465 [Balneolaceae bacterium]|nr:hypothetical protein [Balneolaceae bacterium]
MYYLFLNSSLAAYTEVLFLWSRSLVAFPRRFMISIKGNYLWFTTLTDSVGAVRLLESNR